MAIPRIFFISKATTPAGGSNPVSVIRMSAADPPLVVKAERINLGNDVDLGVTRAMESKMVTRSVEFMGKLYAAATKNFPDMRMLYPEEVTVVRSTLRHEVVEAQPERYIWYVLGFVENLCNVRGLIEDANKTKAGKVFNYLARNKSAMKDLGRIWSVDAFLGSTDRFAHALDGGTEGIANDGNIFLTGNKKETEFKFTGIDFVDPTGPFLNLHHRFRPGEGDVWVGQLLKDSEQAARESLLRAIVADLSARIKRAGFAALPSGHAGEVIKGAKEASASLKTFLNKLTGSTGVPPNVMDRMRLLGW